MDRQALIDKAKKHGFPLNVLFTSLCAYKWQRRLVHGKLVSKKVDPTTGILAGAMAAPYEMLLFTIDCLIEIKELLPFPTVDLTCG